MSDIIKITDFSAPQLDVYARLSENQLLHYNEPFGEGLFVAESPNVIIRALDAGGGGQCGDDGDRYHNGLGVIRNDTQRHTQRGDDEGKFADLCDSEHCLLRKQQI